jgi:hypothetical protein
MKPRGRRFRHTPYVRGPGSDAGADRNIEGAEERWVQLEGKTMKAFRTLAVAASLATLAACNGNNDAANNEANATLENVDTTATDVNAADANAVDLNAVGANAAGNASNAADSNAAAANTSNAQ